MSRKMSFIPEIKNYGFVLEQMEKDLLYRLSDRKRMTSLGRPLYERINTQIIVTQECPYNCPFCIERQNPMEGNHDADKQIQSLIRVLKEHTNARLTVTGGEPGLYADHVKKIAKVFSEYSNGVFMSINTAGYSKDLNGIANINLSVNDYVNSDYRQFPGCTVQTVFDDEDMTLDNAKKFMEAYDEASRFSFRFLTDLNKSEYDVRIFNELRKDKDVKVGTFRIGDFFVYCTFDWRGRHARITLGDMRQQRLNDYKDGYSNIIIHPDGRIGVNWN